MRELDGRGFIADTGKPRKDWLNEYIHPDDQPLVLRTIREAVRTKSIFQLEHRVRRTDGTLGWTYSRAVPLFNVNGEILEWFGAASDVTVRKEAEESFRKLAQTLDAEVRARTRELEEQSSQVRDLSWRLLRSQDEERRHIARELHDGVGQILAALGMNIAIVQRESGNLSNEASRAVSESAFMVEELSREIRTMSHLLHPPMLDEIGLPSALRWYVDGFSERSKVKVNLDIPEGLGRLSSEMELTIFRMIQECLTNVHRHSGSTLAAIRVRAEDHHVRIEVQDGGKGIPAEKQAALNSSDRAGVGFRGMRERLRKLNGTLEIRSDATGTTVIASLPLTIASDGTVDKSGSIN